MRRALSASCKTGKSLQHDPNEYCEKTETCVKLEFRKNDCVSAAKSNGLQ